MKSVVWVAIGFVITGAWYVNDVNEQVKNSPGAKIADRMDAAARSLEEVNKSLAKQFCNDIQSGASTPVKDAEIKYGKSMAEYSAAKSKIAEAAKAYQLAPPGNIVERSILESAQGNAKLAYQYAVRDHGRIAEAVRSEASCKVSNDNR